MFNIKIQFQHSKNMLFVVKGLVWRIDVELAS